MAEIDLPGLRTAHLYQVRAREAEIRLCAAPVRAAAGVPSAYPNL